jgi:hypothetical protein
MRAFNHHFTYIDRRFFRSKKNNRRMKSLPVHFKQIDSKVVGLGNEQELAIIDRLNVAFLRVCKRANQLGFEAG